MNSSNPQPSALPARQRSALWLYVVGLALWLLLWTGAMTFVVYTNLRNAEREFWQHGTAYADHLNQLMVGSETVLRGFAALFGAIGASSPETASRYVRQVVEDHPQIFALEVVQKVSRGELARFEAQRRQEGHANFRVKSFSYDADRKWQPPGDKPFHHPIVFMEPMRPGSEDVLGLDVDSVPFLRQAMRQSLARHAPVASHPFRLVEGNLAFVVFCPLPLEHGARRVSAARRMPDDGLVLMVVDAARLAAPGGGHVLPDAAARIYHRDFGRDDPDGVLFETPGGLRSPLEAALFPRYVIQQSLATAGTPFILRMERQAGWSDLSLRLLAMMGVLAVLSTALLLGYMRTHRRGRILDQDNRARLWQLANYDLLTGLPNRMLLMDRLEQAIARAQREGRRLAVMFLDLDDFKRINDTYGHAGGDKLLQFVAARLGGVVRQADTVARMSGDEFIVLVDGIEHPDAPAVLSQKIGQALAEGFELDGRPIPVRSSIGIAVFPEDGTYPDALIRQADLGMYANKQAHRRPGGAETTPG